jgi:Uncharacterized conserved protein
MFIFVRVIPRSGRNKLEWETSAAGDVAGFGSVGADMRVHLRARLTAPPVDNAANEALVKLLADQLALPKRAITIVRGATSRQKIIEIADLTVEELRRRLHDA